MNKNNSGFKKLYFDMIIDIFERNNKVEKAILYGLRVRGNYKEGLDIDIAIFLLVLDFQDI